MLEQNLYDLTEKYNVFMNIEREDKERFKGIISWAGEMMELNVKDKYARNITPYRAEIWTCNFGENVGCEINKIRPALIISDDYGNVKAPTVTVIPITSREARQFTHVAIGEEDLVYVENEIRGTITAEGMRNVSKARLGRKIGKVSSGCILRVEKAIQYALGMYVEEKETMDETELAPIVTD